jgi:WD40 repeat protein/serine/threonine protein kinase
MSEIHHSERDPLDQLAESFLARYRAGECPPLSEYTEEYPELAEEIRELFPALVVMEKARPGRDLEGGADDPTGANKVEIPSQLGDYRLVRELGRGGMGVVFEAVQESLHRHVALKVLPFHSWVKPKHVERFQREAEAAARLHHTNIVPVFGVGEHEGIHYYAMQFIHGQGLDAVLDELKRLRQKGTAIRNQEPGVGGQESGVRDRQSASKQQALTPAPCLVTPGEVLAHSVAESLLTGQCAGSGIRDWGSGVREEKSMTSSTPPTCHLPSDSGSRSELSSQTEFRYFRSVAQIGIQVAEALAYAHRQGVLHRDIKPSNLMLDTEGRVWITDFGLAKTEDSEELTNPGDMVGTVRYMAPERFQGKADPRSDIYGLGITLYEMLTLRPPFGDSHRQQLLQQIAEQDPLLPHKLDRKIPRDLETVVLKAIAKEPGRRYAAAEDMAEDLSRFLADRPVKARRSSAWERTWRWCRRNPALAGTAGLAGGALSAVASLAIALAIHQYQAAAQLRGEQRQTAQALEQAESERDRAERLSTTLALDGALSRCEQSDVALGVLWLARALEIAPEKEPELRRAIRANLAAWGRELHPLKGLLQHQDAVHAVVWSPDGKTVLTGGWERCGRLWSADTGSLVGSPLQMANRIEAVAFSPDGRSALTLGEGRAQIWDVGTARPLGLPIQSKGFIGAATFSPDGRAVVTGDAQGRVSRWDATTAGFLEELITRGPGVHALAFSPDGQRVVTGCDDHTARLWESRSGKPCGEPLPHQGLVCAVAFSHDGSRLVTGSLDGAARLWNTATGKLLVLPLQHGARVRSVAFSADDRTVLTGSLDGTARLWNTATGKPLGLPLRHRGQAGAAALSPDEKTVVTGGSENVVRLWDVSQALRSQPSFKHGNWVRGATFSPCGRYLLTGSDDHTARLWDLETEKPVGSPFRHNDVVRAVAFSPDGRTLLTGSFDGTAQRWAAATGGPLGPRIRHRSSVWAVAFSPECTSFLTGHQDGTVQRWDSATGTPVGIPLRHPDRINGVAWSPDGRTIATACLDGAARLWNAATGQPLDIALRHQSAVWSVAFSPDGTTVLTGSWDGTARLWDAATGQPRGRLFPHQAKVEAAAFSPDGRTIITGGLDHAGRLWDVATGKPIGPPLVQDDLVVAVAFHPNGKLVVTAGGFGIARLWEAPSPAEGPVEDLVLQSQLLTGMQLDHQGAAIVLPAEAWYQLRRRAGLHLAGRSLFKSIR